MNPHHSPVGTIRRPSCVVCGKPGLQEIATLPNLPLTGILVPPDQPHEHACFDQGLLYCDCCGHAQLREAVPPAYLYQRSYSNRTSRNPISTRVNDNFLAFVRRVSKGAHFDAALELGCNDLYLARQLRSHSTQVFGIDPIWKDRPAPSEEGLTVMGAFVEDLQGQAASLPRFELVVAVHTLEHIASPKEALASVLNLVKDDALIVLEVPSLDTILLTTRFDQVYHQHLNYFSLGSMLRLIQELGCTYVDHSYNHELALGSMLVAFRKGRASACPPCSPPPIAIESVHQRYSQFRQGCDLVVSQLERVHALGCPLVGLGASHLLPMLAYHLGGHFDLIEMILDDDPGKDGLLYPHVKPRISLPSNYTEMRRSGLLITSLDSARVLLRRAQELSPRYVIQPCSIL